MKGQLSLKHQFVEFIPDELQDKTIYISLRFATVTHKCCCGCGLEVVTPLSPTDWKLIFDGVSISLEPSIGNWGFPCQSHYWIRQNQVRWSYRMTRQEIDAGRRTDATAKQQYFDSVAAPAETVQMPSAEKAAEVHPRQGWWQRLWRKVWG